MSACIARAFLLLTLVSLCFSQDIGVGPCPKIKFQKDFNMTRFSGEWFQIERYQDDYFTTQTIKCNKVSFKVVDERTVAINNTYISTAQVGSRILQGTYNAIWQADVVDKNEPAKMVVEMQIAPNQSYYGDGSNLQMNYWVLDTDYENNAMVWTCTSNGKFFTQYAEILHRTDSMDPDVLVIIHRRLWPYRLRPEYFRSVKHNQSTDCDY